MLPFEFVNGLCVEVILVGFVSRSSLCFSLLFCSLCLEFHFITGWLRLHVECLPTCYPKAYLIVWGVCFGVSKQKRHAGFWWIIFICRGQGCLECMEWICGLRKSLNSLLAGVYRIVISGLFKGTAVHRLSLVIQHEQLGLRGRIYTW